jgi:hypothetical protein
MSAVGDGFPPVTGRRARRAGRGAVYPSTLYLNLEIEMAKKRRMAEIIARTETAAAFMTIDAMRERLRIAGQEAMRRAMYQAGRILMERAPDFPNMDVERDDAADAMAMAYHGNFLAPAFSAAVNPPKEKPVPMSLDELRAVASDGLAVADGLKRKLVRFDNEGCIKEESRN